MSYDNFELSQFEGSPIELYTFYSDSFTTPYTYTSYDEDIEYNGNTYLAIPIKRSQPELSQEYEAQSLSIDVHRDNPLAKLWAVGIPPRIVWVKIERYHSDDSASETVVFWQGRVRGVAWRNNIATIDCYPLNTAFDKNGLKMWYGAPCQYMLYDTNTCKVPAVNFKLSATITQINGYTLTSPQFATLPGGGAAPAGWWIGGFVSTSDGSLRYVIDHSGGGGTIVTLAVAFDSPSIAVGDTVDIFAGCDRKYTTCKNKFNNLTNYGGWPFVPAKNPFQYPLT
jgi:uncharacterized phage protein (TIGR02218 family)